MGKKLKKAVIIGIYDSICSARYFHSFHESLEINHPLDCTTVEIWIWRESSGIWSVILGIIQIMKWKSLQAFYCGICEISWERFFVKCVACISWKEKLEDVLHGCMTTGYKVSKNLRDTHDTYLTLLWGFLEV